MLKVKYSNKSLKNLQEISFYISWDNPLQAKKVLDNIKLSINYLLTFPYLWKEIKEWYREIVSKHKYRIVYIVKENIIIIVSIFKYQDLY